MNNSIPNKVVEILYTDNFKEGSHISAQYMADRLQVSRSPINKALKLLENKGLLKREPNKGYFLARTLDKPPSEFLAEIGLDEDDKVTNVYFQIADDRLRGLLPNEFSETQLKKIYNLTAAKLQTILNRISKEGWAYKKPGYGWFFSPMLTTPENLIQSYRFRLALEPDALLEPSYNLDPKVLERSRNTELALLDGGIESSTADQIHLRGVNFHSAIVQASGNPFFVDAINRVNRVRLLLSYRSMQNRSRFKKSCLDHLQILDLLEKKRNGEAAIVLREHLKTTISSMSQISDILKS